MGRVYRNSEAKSAFSFSKVYGRQSEMSGGGREEAIPPPLPALVKCIYKAYRGGQCQMPCLYTCHVPTILHKAGVVVVVPLPIWFAGDTTPCLEVCLVCAGVQPPPPSLLEDVHVPEDIFRKGAEKVKKSRELRELFIGVLFLSTASKVSLHCPLPHH